VQATSPQRLSLEAVLDDLTLSEPHAMEGQADPPIADARALLEEAATRSTGIGGWSSADPLRLHKGRITDLLHCPRRAVARDDTIAARIDDLVLGDLVDGAAKLMALGAAAPVTGASACAFLDALDQPQAREHLATIGEPAAAALMAEADARIDRLVSVWPAIAPEWWPRVEEPVRVPLAGGAVTLGGKLDILLGGPPTGRPSVAIEVKGGRWHDSVRSDAHLYALLLGLRDGIAPAVVMSIAAADGTTHTEPIRTAVLVHTAERVAAAIDTAARLAAGEAPEARRGFYCATCPVRTGCPAHASEDAA
jgi:hypothetical protein